MSEQWTVGSGDQDPVDGPAVTEPLPVAPGGTWDAAPAASAAAAAPAGAPAAATALDPAPPSWSEPVAQPRRWPGVRVRTVVFGVILLVLAVGNATPVWLDVDVDAPTAAVALLGGLGLAMVLGAASAGRRQRH